MPKHILALDQGTTSSRAIVFGHDGRMVAVAQQEFPQLLPGPGLVEHDPEAIWSSQLAVAREAVSKSKLDAWRHRRAGRHQSARDDDPLGARHGTSGSQRHRLAEPRERGDLRPPESRRS